jgi:enamine deaminase RidA (YjgF/YER057c/UK114 family)
VNFSERLAQLGLELPAPVNPLGSYRTVSVLGNQLYVSGLGPFENGKPIVGTVGVDVSLEDARHAARLTMLMILACVNQACGLDNIERCSRLTVYVRADQSFTQHPQVANGASDSAGIIRGGQAAGAQRTWRVHVANGHPGGNRQHLRAKVAGRKLTKPVEDARICPRVRPPRAVPSAARFSTG